MLTNYISNPIKIIERTLNLASPKLIGHGKRVAYKMFKALYQMEAYNDEKIHDICMLGLLHDIGAYKTEDINSILGFDKENEWNHAIYGYLFLKYFSPIRSLAPALLFHHAGHSQMLHLSEEHQMLAKLLRQSDQADTHQCLNGGYSNCTDMHEDAEFNLILYKSNISDKDIESYIKMLAFSIDFRSPQTMIHTFAATYVAEVLAILAGADEIQISSLKTGAMLHDIGKMGIPLHILEGTNKKLSPSDMAIMKSHVVLSGDVLSGCVSEEVLNIAINHHEKLNGRGYPKGLDEHSLAYLDRIMAVADVFSAISVSRSYQSAFSKEKSIEILSKFKHENLLDHSIIELAINHYDEIISSLNAKSKPIIATYEAIEEERHWIHSKIATGEYDIVNM